MIEDIKNRREIVKSRIAELLNLNKNNRERALYYVEHNQKDEFEKLCKEDKIMKEEFEELQEELTMLELCLVIDGNVNN